MWLSLLLDLSLCQQCTHATMHTYTLKHISAVTQANCYPAPSRHVSKDAPTRAPRNHTRTKANMKWHIARINPDVRSSGLSPPFHKYAHYAQATACWGAAPIYQLHCVGRIQGFRSRGSPASRGRVSVMPHERRMSRTLHPSPYLRVGQNVVSQEPTSVQAESRMRRWPSMCLRLVAAGRPRPSWPQQVLLWQIHLNHIDKIRPLLRNAGLKPHTLLLACQPSSCIALGLAE